MIASTIVNLAYHWSLMSGKLLRSLGRYDLSSGLNSVAGEVSEELLADLEDDADPEAASSSSRPAAVSRPQMRKCRTKVEWLILMRWFSCKQEPVHCCTRSWSDRETRYTI